MGEDERALARAVESIVRETPSLSALANAGNVGAGRRDSQPQRERYDLGSAVRATMRRSRPGDDDG